MEEKKPAFVEFKSDNSRLIIRSKYPSFRIEVEESCSNEELASALKKCAEFLKKRV